MEHNNTLKAPEYVKAYRCLLDKCDDTCCSGWHIPVGRENYYNLKQLMEPDDTLSAVFERSVLRNEEEGAEDYIYAVLKMNEDTYCPFLDEDKLCIIHKKYGFDNHIDSCALYPFYLTELSDRAVVTGSMSCPEMARQCLVKNDFPFTQDYTPPEEFKYLYYNHVNNAGGDIYESSYDTVNSVLMQLAGHNEFDFREKLFFIIQFIRKLNYKLYRGADTDAEEEIEKVSAEFSDKSNLKSIAAEFNSKTYEIAGGVNIAMIVFEKMMEQLILERFNVLISSTVNSCIENNEHRQGEDIEVKLDDLFPVYYKRRVLLEEKHADRIDKIFSNYVGNFILQKPYTSFDTLSDYATSLLIRVSLLKFLFYCNPSLVSVTKENGNGADAELIDNTAILVFYNFARNYEHNAKFQKGVLDSMKKGGLDSALDLEMLAAM